MPCTKYVHKYPAVALYEYIDATLPALATLPSGYPYQYIDPTYRFFRHGASQVGQLSPIIITLSSKLNTDGYASKRAHKLHRSGPSVLTTNYPTVHASSTLSVRSREHTDVHPALTVQYHTFDKMHIASQNWCLCFVANCILLASSSDTAGATQSPSKP